METHVLHKCKRSDDLQLQVNILQKDNKDRSDKMAVLMHERNEARGRIEILEIELRNAYRSMVFHQGELASFRELFNLQEKAPSVPPTGYIYRLEK